MKKSLLCITLIAVAFSGIYAQEVKFGIKGGLNLAGINGDETDDLNMRTSFHIGGAAEIKLNEKFAIQPELLYSSQGAVIDTPDKPVLQYDYINLPVMGKVFVTEAFSVELGPQVGYNINAQIKLDDIELDIEDVSPIDFGVNVGVGYTMASGLFFNARYNLGLSNINDGEFSDEIKNQHGVIQASIGYYIF